MKPVTGIFRSAESAEHAINRLQSIGIGEKEINILTPGASTRQIADVPTSDTEQSGMGKALGGLVGGASGLALGSAAASLLIPGIGPITAVGILASALFGAGGAAAGIAAGGAIEGSMSDGLPRDELFLYEDALRQGRTVVIALADDEDQAGAARSALEQEGAESVDAAREQWWIGLRDVEEEHYRADGRDFTADELAYRRGFEAALHPGWRGKSYQEAREDLRKAFPDLCDQDPFRCGYERGEQHYRSHGEEG
jgi:hypothetical protein